MLRVLVYGFAAVSAMVAVAVVGMYVYLVRLPVDRIVEKSRGYVEKQVDGVRRFARDVQGDDTAQVREAADALRKVADDLKRAVGNPEATAVKPAEQRSLPSDKPAAVKPTVPQPAVPQEPPAASQPAPAQPPDAAPASPAAATNTAQAHVVQKGDTLYGIARAYYHDGNKWQRLAAGNNLKPPYRLRPGMKLTIPPPEAADAPKPPVVVPAKDLAAVEYQGGRGL